MASNSTDETPLEYNKKWRCYLEILVTSLANLISIGEAIRNDLPVTYYGVNSGAYYMFGAVTFALSLLVLLFDRVGFMHRKFDFKSLGDGKVEGWMLFSIVLWWIVGVIVITRAGALGYAALNIYFSAWLSLFACMKTLDSWGGEKDLLTLKELTSVSATLPSWWILFWASLITFGSAADAVHLSQSVHVNDSCNTAMSVGIVVAAISAFFILSHYEFLQCCHACSSWLSYGGWFELACSIFGNILLAVGLNELTGAGKIASSITGNYASDFDSMEYLPGSNIYVSIWYGLDFIRLYFVFT